MSIRVTIIRASEEELAISDRTHFIITMKHVDGNEWDLTMSPLDNEKSLEGSQPALPKTSSAKEIHGLQIKLRAYGTTRELGTELDTLA